MVFADREKQKNKSSKIITSPFPDGFNLLTRHKISHQKVQDAIRPKVCSMELTWKLRKCKPLYMVSGKPSDVKFTLTIRSTNSEVVIKL